ncbi:MAG: NAD(P)H-dependent oxidoreductase [Pseudomonadota bacterium]
MTNLLQLTTSLFDGAGKQGVSSQLSDELITGLKALNTDLQVSVRDFAASPTPHLDHAWLQALFTPATDRSAEQSAKVSHSDSLIAELQAANTVVIGVPMYNFSIPSMLKAWIDHVSRAGVTFSYTEKGPQGLLTGKKVYLVIAMGGKHAEGVTDFVRPYLRTVLGFLGMTDIDFVVADGLAMGDESRAQGLQQAHEQIKALLTKAQVAANDNSDVLTEEQAA